MYKTIFVLSPTSVATGGTELLQQLVFKLRKLHQEAYMYYLDTYENSPVQRVFGPRYNNPAVVQIEDRKENIMIVPENSMYLLLRYKKITKAVWWLSVDNYKGATNVKVDIFHSIYRFLIDKYYRKKDKKWLHFVQSEYAYLYCVKNRQISIKQVFYLSDYLNKTFISDGETSTNNNRDDIVLYNPKKGAEFTALLRDTAPELRWIPIINMTSEEIKVLMQKSKVYIDFGNHPGKDRLPREAAINGCCIITGLRGAAANDIDIMIPHKYKHSERNICEIIANIKECLSNYETLIKDFDIYREKIKKEESVFDNEIRKIFINGL